MAFSFSKSAAGYDFVVITYRVNTLRTTLLNVSQRTGETPPVKSSDVLEAIVAKFQQLNSQEPSTQPLATCSKIRCRLATCSKIRCRTTVGSSDDIPVDIMKEPSGMIKGLRADTAEWLHTQRERGRIPGGENIVPPAPEISPRGGKMIEPPAPEKLGSQAVGAAPRTTLFYVCLFTIAALVVAAFLYKRRSRKRNSPTLQETKFAT